MFPCNSGHAYEKEEEESIYQFMKPISTKRREVIETTFQARI